MFNFFVLGLIPGTNIQISFTMWCEAVAAICLSFCLRQRMHYRQLAGELPPTISPDVMLPPQPGRLILRIAAALPAGSAGHRLKHYLQVFSGAQNIYLPGYLSRRRTAASE